MTNEVLQRVVIRELIEEWAVTRDAGNWERFARVWHPHGVMIATWFQGSAEAFIQVSREGFERGVRILHFLGGSVIDLSDGRAIAQTKMTITQRGVIDGVMCDVVCTGRFFDFLVDDGERWSLRLRQPIYEQDRLDPVDPAAVVRLDAGQLNRYPVGYRHLAYLQRQAGYEVKLGLPGLTGDAVHRLSLAGDAWLGGGELDWR